MLWWVIGIGATVIYGLQKFLRQRGEDKGTLSSAWLAQKRGERNSGK